MFMFILTMSDKIPDKNSWEIVFLAELVAELIFTGVLLSHFMELLSFRFK